MGKIIIQEYTTKNPLQMIGKEAGICWGADIEDIEKNLKRGRDCVTSEHGRTWEFPQIYMVLKGYSARVIRELYTHIGGAPTRLQASTRYINYEEGFDYITPPSVLANDEAKVIYDSAIKIIQTSLKALRDLNIPKEDCAMLLPLGMTTDIVCRTNFRNLVDMSHQRMCSRAYWEFRALFNDIRKALSEYSEEWKELVDKCFMPKCKIYGYCKEKNSCGLMSRKNEQ